VRRKLLPGHFLISLFFIFQATPVLPDRQVECEEQKYPYKQAPLSRPQNPKSSRRPLVVFLLSATAFGGRLKNTDARFFSLGLAQK
jgi:hypothetical protein